MDLDCARIDLEISAIVLFDLPWAMAVRTDALAGIALPVAGALRAHVA